MGWQLITLEFMVQVDSSVNKQCNASVPESFDGELVKKHKFGWAVESEGGRVPSKTTVVGPQRSDARCLSFSTAFIFFPLCT